jgi:hypothetical protein
MLKSKNKVILDELKNLKEIFFETIIEIPIQEKNDIINFQILMLNIQNISERLKKVPQIIGLLNILLCLIRVDRIKNTYQEKIALEEEGITIDDDNEYYKGIIYVFRDKIPIHKLKTLNNDTRTSLMQLGTHLNSFCLLLSEYLDKEVS